MLSSLTYERDCGGEYEGWNMVRGEEVSGLGREGLVALQLQEEEEEEAVEL